LCHAAHGTVPNAETGWGMLNIPAALRQLDQELSRTEDVP
jgi:hypothetical protein